MKNKKIIFVILAIIVAIIIIISLVVNNKNSGNSNNQFSEYTPEEEISDEQMRETTVTLYFLQQGTEALKSEGRLISATKLLENPYQEIVNLLIEGPQNTDLTNVFPENTRLLDSKIENHCVTLNFSEEIANFKDDVQKYNIINSILNSLTELNEVNSIKILVNNQTNENFEEEYSAIY